MLAFPCEEAEPKRTERTIPAMNVAIDSSAVMSVISPIRMSSLTMKSPRMSALASSQVVFSDPMASSTVPRPFTVCFTPSPCATSWKVTFQKNASALRYSICEGSMRTSPIGITILLNLAIMLLYNWRRRAPFAA